ncbi:MAG: hypothetical protein KIG91_03300, partial [Treponema sp.]|nr:hypothetical protein [Treponema sp.]
MAVKNIKKDTSLRKAILQAAITGQLISNVEETTENGRQLLDRIIEERNKKLLVEWEDALKKNPKAKKPAPIVATEIDEDEIPFEIPENWCWCKLEDICEFENGDRSSKYPVESDYVSESPLKKVSNFKGLKKKARFLRKKSQKSGFCSFKEQIICLSFPYFSSRIVIIRFILAAK